MKTIEEKAKAYDEALERARQKIDAGLLTEDDLSYIFPEFRESEDERIRKELLDFVRSFWAEHKEKLPQVNRWVTYLEKQKKQEPEIKYVYPKFRKGDVIEPITPNGYFTPVRIVNIYDGSYSCRSDDGKAYLSLPIKHEDEYRLVKQKPAEKQDYSGLNDLERAIHRGFLCAGVENVPVTIIKETARECLAQMNPAEWSEEDERYINGLIGLIEDIKVGISPKLRGVTADRCITFLKSLRPSWKPSEEQMKALEVAFRKDGDDDYRNIINSLYNDLKKL